LRDVRLEAPDPFTSGRLLPLGIEGAPSSWPFPDRARKVIAISPFLSTETLTRIRAGAPASTLLTRAAAADHRVGRALRDWCVNVLDAAVDGGGDDHLVVEDATGESPYPVPSALLDLTGLHAKTVVIDGDDGQSAVITGSANLTRQAWSKNVEFDA